MIQKVKHIVREDNFLSLAGNLSVAFFGLLGFAILARTLSVDEFGIWVLFITASSFVEMLRFGLTSTGLVRYLSGAEDNYYNELVGANALIGVVSTFIISSLLLALLLIFKSPIYAAGYHIFFIWYPLVAIANLPWNTALVLLHAQQRYDAMLTIRLVNSLLFLLVLLVHIFHPLSLNQLAMGYLLANMLTSALTVFKRWDQLLKMRMATQNAIRQLLNFGRYTTITLIGTNLLRSLDTFIISFSPLGNAAVALYSVPLKLTELQQIPLRSFAATAFPKMSKASSRQNTAAWMSIFNTYTGAITLLFIPFSIFAFIFAEPLVVLLGGSNYAATQHTGGTDPADIMRIFALYGLLLPLDRMTGIGLDSINQPRKNAVKVLLMVIANIIGDIIAVYIFKSLLLVALASVLFTLVGIYVGMYFLRLHVQIHYSSVITAGVHFYQSLYHKILRRKPYSDNQQSV